MNKYYGLSAINKYLIICFCLFRQPKTTIPTARVASEDVAVSNQSIENSTPYPHVVYMNYDEFYAGSGAENETARTHVSHLPEMTTPQQQYYLEKFYFENSKIDEKNFFWQSENNEIDQNIERSGNWFRDVTDPVMDKQFLVQNLTHWRSNQNDGVIDDSDMSHRYNDFESPSLQKYHTISNNELSYCEDQQKNFLIHPLAEVSDIHSVKDHYTSNNLNNRNIVKNTVVTDFQNSIGWRHPTISELIDVYFESEDDAIKSNAAAFLQHVVFENEDKKSFAIEFGAVVKLIHVIDTTKSSQVQKNVCGALRNLTYKNQKAKDDLIRNQGINILLNLIIKTKNEDIKDEASGVIWNMTSSKELKKAILDESHGGDNIIMPILECLEETFLLHFIRECKNNGKTTTHSSTGSSHTNNLTSSHTIENKFDFFCRFLGPGETESLSIGSLPHRSNPPFFLRNLTGALRNLSSAGKFARDSLRKCQFLIMALLSILKISLNDQFLLNSKICENCVCTLRNLSYRLQEVEEVESHWEESLETFEATQGGK